MAETTVTSAGRDIIVDFEDGLDLINLSNIDANTGAAGNQAFVFTPFTGVAGQLRAVVINGNTYIEGTVDADTAADFRIVVRGTPVIDGADFIL